MIRDGSKKEIPAEELVMDDIVELSAGGQIPADAVVLEGQLNVNESLLTGEADEIVKNAEDRMVRLVDENEVTKKAYEQAAAIIDSAKKTSKDMRLGAMEYAESVLADAEGKLKELKSVVYSESIKTDDYFAQTLDVLAENIQELRMGK